jgi:hypothetical protein
MNQPEERVMEMRLRGYGSTTREATVRVMSFDRPVRLRRALSGLVLAWLLALVCILIPVAHFFLVPGFLGYGAYLFASRWRTSISVMQAFGICPDCDTSEELEIAENWNPPHRVTCNGCQRSLVLEFGDSEV